MLAEMDDRVREDAEVQGAWQKVDAAVDDALASMEIYYTEDGQKALAKLGGKEPIEMHQRNGRWYASASTRDAAQAAMTYHWMMLPIAGFERQLEIAKKAKSVEQLREELKAEKETPPPLDPKPVHPVNPVR